MRPKRAFKIFVFVLICVLGTLIYSNTFDSSLHFDDRNFFVKNAQITHISDLKSIWKAYAKPTRFISFFTFALNYHFHQFDLAAYHVTNLIIHLLNGLLIYLFSTSLLKTPRMKDHPYSSQRDVFSLFVSLVFLCHPLQTQAVTYITQRFASLATFFYLLSIYLYLKARLLDHGGGKRIILFFISLFAGLLGMFTKEIAFTLPIMIGLVEICFLGNAPLKKSFTIKLNRNVLIFLFIIMLFALTIPLAFSFNVKNIIFRELPSSSFEHEIITSKRYLLTQFRVIVKYLQLLFVPINQNFDYHFPLSYSLLEPKTFACFCILLFLVFMTYKLFQNHRLLSFGLAWFFVTLSVESSIIPIPHVIFEHRVYLPSVGFCLFFCGFLFLLCRRSARTFVCVMCVVVCCLSILTFQRNKVWKTEVTFWEDIVKKSPHKARAHGNLAAAYLNAKEIQKAIDHLHKALTIDPNQATYYNNLGKAYLYVNDFDMAEKHLKRAYILRPNFLANLNNLGVLYEKKRDLEKAKEFYYKSMKLSYGDLKPALNLADIYRNERDIDNAIKIYRRIVDKFPHATNSLYVVTELYLINKDYENAFTMGRLILKRGDDGKVVADLAALFAIEGRHGMAQDLFVKALSLSPKDVEIYLETGKFLGNLKRFDAAIEVWQQGLKIDPSDQRFLKLIEKAKRLKEER